MRVLVFILVAVLLAGILFWNDLFNDEGESTDSGEDVIQVVDLAPDEEPAPAVQSPEEGLAQLMNEGRWEEALRAIEARPGSKENTELLMAKHSCLVKLGRRAEAEQVLNALLRKDPASPQAALAAVTSVGGDELAPLEIRRRLSCVSDGFGALDRTGVDLLVDSMKKINAELPGSIEGLIKATGYTIKPGDNLWDICRKFNRDGNLNIAVGLISLLNRLKRPDLIHSGDILKIPDEKVSIRIWRKNWLMAVFIGDTLLSAYRVGLGKEGSTPTGDYIIKSRLEEPDWYSEQKGKIIPFGDKENVLGTRWLGFENQPNARGLGIHGTVDNDSIGRNMSSGCIRLTNEEVEALFEIIERGTPVKIL